MKPSKIRNRTIHNAPLSLRSRSMSSHLSGQLRKTYGHRSIRVIPGDSVSINRGVYKNIDGKVEKVKPHLGVVISGVQKQKAEGKKIDVYIHPSNLLVTSLNLDDKWRAKKLKVDTKIDKAPVGDTSSLSSGSVPASPKHTDLPSGADVPLEDVEVKPKDADEDVKSESSSDDSDVKPEDVEVKPKDADEDVKSESSSDDTKEDKS
ncbi:MAG: 50S ribosomal protein L24 [Cenarchaeum sp. SB0663_bin_5]|nr:50S ribosomal protein L24 [Cenarchaeum sp. SB0663_bin_5]MYH04814.1 50S ribosomal protein L24 [Cenarchaeum sp. SB0675_bin_21]MYL11071.1 50S ribosomal protein L24 [Cenarchaeum sp. SB0669_bin_11]